MNINEYQDQAMGFRLTSAWNPDYARYGLVGEVGELMSLYAKAIRDGRKEDHALMLKKELGDVLWFVAAIAADNGYELEDVAVGNIDKLASRQQRGTLTGSGDNR
jgi:NTP pyrophosphatase (non-canonical NTP hydrolase)